MNYELELRQVVAKEISSNGEAAINDMIAERREESLHLEFKTFSSDTTLTRDDRKMLAKAICGFANAEGGILIVGVETKKNDGVDAAFAKRPVADLNRFRRLIEAAYRN
jgi:predicted HTH transcriptional regulator